MAVKILKLIVLEDDKWNTTFLLELSENIKKINLKDFIGLFGITNEEELNEFKEEYEHILNNIENYPIELDTSDFWLNSNHPEYNDEFLANYIAQKDLIAFIKSKIENKFMYILSSDNKSDYNQNLRNVLYKMIAARRK